MFKIVTDNIAYAKVARVIRVRDSYEQEAGHTKLVEKKKKTKKAVEEEPAEVEEEAPKKKKKKA